MLTGNICALITPFTKDLLVDEKAFASLLTRQIDSGIDGILLFGSTGEGVFLSKTQKIALLKIAKAIIQDRTKLIVSVSDNNTMKAMENAKIALEMGADYGLILPPFYLKASDEEIQQHFTYVAKEDLPLILYNNPARTGVHIRMDVIEELCLNKMIVGIKDCSQNIDYCQQILKKTKLSFLSGDDQFALGACILGAHGLISIISNAFPIEMTEMIHHGLHGKFEEARKIFSTFSTLLHAMGVASNPKCIKYILYRMGLCKMHVGLPLIDLHRVHQRQIDQALDLFGAKSNF